MVLSAAEQNVLSEQVHHVGVIWRSSTTFCSDESTSTYCIKTFSHSSLVYIIKFSLDLLDEANQINDQENRDFFNSST